jgi:hypothetical protein
MPAPSEFQSSHTGSFFAQSYASGGQRAESPVLSELSNAVVDVVASDALRLQYGDDDGDDAWTEPSVWIATPYSDRSVDLVDVAQSELPPRDADGLNTTGMSGTMNLDLGMTLTSRLRIDDLAEVVVGDVFGDVVQALIDSVPADERLSVTTAYTSFQSYTPGHTPPPSARPNIMDRFDLRDVIRDEAKSAVSSWIRTVDVLELETADSDPPSAPPSPLPSPARAKVMAAREGISEAEAETRRWQELIYGVAVRLNTIPSIQLWPEGLSFPSGTSLKVAAAAGNVPLAMACAAALGQLEASFAKLATETQRILADRAAVDKTTERLRLFVEETKLGAEKAKVLNAELVQRLLQAKEDMRDTLQAAERLTLAYSDSAASLTFLTAQKKTLQKDLHAAEMKFESVTRSGRELKAAEAIHVAQHRALLDRMEARSKDRLDDLRAHRVAQVFVAELTERVHLEKMRREKDAATKIQAIQRGKTGRRKYAAKKRMVDALRLLDERRRQLLDKEMTLAPIRDDLTRKENDLASKVAEWKKQLMAVRQASDVELAPFRDTLKLEQTRVLALHSEMDSLRTLKSLDASRDVSREQLSMDAKQASQQAKQSERLQFPPLRVPAGTGSLEKSPSKSSGGKEMWAVPVKARSKMKDKGKRQLKDLADLYAPAVAQTIGTYGLPPDQARPQVLYRSLQPSGSSSRLQQSGENSLSNLHSKSMSSLHRTLAPRKLKDVCGQPVRSEKWVLQTALE